MKLLATFFLILLLNTLGTCQVTDSIFVNLRNKIVKLDDAYLASNPSIDSTIIDSQSPKKLLRNLKNYKNIFFIKNKKKLMKNSDSMTPLSKATIAYDTIYIKRRVYIRLDSVSLTDMISLIDDSLLRQRIQIGYLEKENTIKANLISKQTLIIDKQLKINMYSKLVMTLALSLLTITAMFSIVLYLKHQNLIKISNLKNKFFSIIAHDIKSPLRRIKINLDILYKNNKIDTLFTLSKEVRALYEFTNNFINWAKLRQNQSILNVAIIDFNTTLDEIAGYLSPLLAEKNISLNNLSENNIIFNADKNMISLLIKNLLTNAIKFSYKNSRIDVATVLNNKLEISFRDYGVGIADDVKSRLFNKDHLKINIGEFNEQGSGLGLLICYEFIKLHKGTIKVIQHSVGTEFLIVLPIM